MTLLNLNPLAQVCEASDMNEAMLLAKHKPDVALAIVDLRLPMIDGMAGLPLLRHLCPHAKLVIMSALFDAKDVAMARSRGADGFLPKSMSADDVLRALRAILNGEPYFFETGMQLTTASPSLTDPLPANCEEPPTLTQRQMQVLALLVQGKPNKIIGDELGMAPGTVKIHISSVLRALKVTNRTQAVLAAGRWGLKL